MSWIDEQSFLHPCPEVDNGELLPIVTLVPQTFLSVTALGLPKVDYPLTVTVRLVLPF